VKRQENQHNLRIWQAIAYAALTLTKYPPIIVNKSVLGNFMKKIVIGLLAASTLLSSVTTTLAADLDPGAPPPPTDDLRPASYDWSGMYTGVNLAGTCSIGDIIDGGTRFDLDGCAKTIGMHVGYNYQMDAFVGGLEANFDYNHGYYIDDQTTASTRFRMPMTAGMKGRLGYAIDNTLLYTSLGYVYGQGRHSEFIGLPLPGAWSSEAKKAHHGLSLGFGMEHALTDVIRLRAGYEYTMFKDNSYSTTCCTAKTDFGTHAFMIGASYVFSTGSF
jgi:outer membrane immunogenic protein